MLHRNSFRQVLALSQHLLVHLLLGDHVIALFHQTAQGNGVLHPSKYLFYLHFTVLPGHFLGYDISKFRQEIVKRPDPGRLQAIGYDGVHALIQLHSGVAYWCSCQIRNIVVVGLILSVSGPVPDDLCGTAATGGNPFDITEIPQRCLQILEHIGFIHYQLIYSNGIQCSLNLTAGSLHDRLNNLEL